MYFHFPTQPSLSWKPQNLSGAVTPGDKCQVMWQAHLHNHRGGERSVTISWTPITKSEPPELWGVKPRADQSSGGWSPAQLPQQLSGSPYRQTGGSLLQGYGAHWRERTSWDCPRFLLGCGGWGKDKHKEGLRQFRDQAWKSRGEGMCVCWSKHHELQWALALSLVGGGASSWCRAVPAPGQTEAVSVLPVCSPGLLGIPAQPPVCLALGPWSCSSLACPTHSTRPGTSECQGVPWHTWRLDKE